jgi:hypothetical protein
LLSPPIVGECREHFADLVGAVSKMAGNVHQGGVFGTHYFVSLVRAVSGSCANIVGEKYFGHF